MIHLRHNEGDWRYDADTNSLIVCTGEHVALCSERKPVQGARPVVRKGECEWVVAPAIFYNHQFKPIPNAECILLTGSPEKVNLLLWALL